MFGECHAHLMMDGENYRAAAERHRPAVDMSALRENFKAWSAAGVGFIRDGGDRFGVSAAAKKIAPEYGIDYISPIFAIHKKGHYGGIVGLPFENMDEYRFLVRRAKNEGADFIKIMISGILDFSGYGKMSEEGLEASEIREMADIAHGEGMTVMAHANGDRVVRAAVEAGIESVEHGYYLTRETLDLLSGSGTAWIPTLAPVGNLIGCGRFPDEALNKILAGQMKNVRYALDAGAHLGLGSDAGAFLVPHGQGLADEYGFMKRAVGEDRLDVLDERLKDTEERIRTKMRR